MAERPCRFKSYIAHLCPLSLTERVSGYEPDDLGSIPRVGTLRIDLCRTRENKEPSSHGHLCRCSTEVVQPLGKRKIAGPNPAFGSHGVVLVSTAMGCIEITGMQLSLNCKKKN